MARDLVFLFSGGWTPPKNPLNILASIIIFFRKSRFTETSLIKI
jgi:hypothetical protein